MSFLTLWTKKKEAKDLDLSKTPGLEEKQIAVVGTICDCRERQLEYIETVDKLNVEIEKLRKAKQKAIEEIQEAKNQLADEVREAKEALARAELDHKMKVEDIEHMQKILDEKGELEVQKKIFQAEKAADAEIKKIRLEYTKKLEGDLKEQMTKLDTTYTSILAALPNVNVKMKA